MTSQSPRIYIYKITFEEVLYYYYGVHKEKKFGEYYMGSPVTHKWCWDFYTPKKQILELFNYTDEGYIEAQKVEGRLIKLVYNTDKWCLNKNCGGKVSLEICRNSGKITGKKAKELGIGVHGRTKEQMTEDGKKGGKKAKELGVGVHGRTKEQMTEDGKKGGKIAGKKAKELGIGICGFTPEQRMENGKKYNKKGGKKTKELGVGIFGLTAEQTIENGKIGGKKAKELGLGIHGLTPEQKSENAKKAGKMGGSKGGKKSSSQKWKCLETGYVSNSGALSRYQRARGIDTSKRIRLS
jgi:hypothetical protein